MSTTDLRQNARILVQTGLRDHPTVGNPSTLGPAVGLARTGYRVFGLEEVEQDGAGRCASGTPANWASDTLAFPRRFHIRNECHERIHGDVTNLDVRSWMGVDAW
jgi:hypothetical protein